MGMAAMEVPVTKSKKETAVVNGKAIAMNGLKAAKESE